MSKTNWHAGLKMSISADEWYKKYRKDTPICQVCKSVLSFIAVANRNRTTHFRHPENSGCPTIETNGALYAHLRPAELDESNAQLLKRWVVDNGYYHLCEILGGSIKYQEFTDILICCIGKVNVKSNHYTCFLEPTFPIYCNYFKGKDRYHF
jgi:hypothetical protein